MSSHKIYWFPAKNYGWGWGVPQTWQGRIVVLAFLLLIAGGAYFRERMGSVTFLAYATGLIFLLVAICWLKGEPLQWRWGERKK